MTTSRLAEFLWVSAQTTKGDGLPEGNQLLKYPLSAAGFSLIPSDMGKWWCVCVCVCVCVIIYSYMS